jgi:hypothetical protein
MTGTVIAHPSSHPSPANLLSSSAGGAEQSPNRRRPRITPMREAVATTPAELIARNTRLIASRFVAFRHSGGEFTGVAELHEEDKASRCREQGKKGHSTFSVSMIRPCFQALRVIEKYFSTGRSAVWIRLWADRRMARLRAT